MHLADEIERRPQPSAREWDRDYLARPRPVVLTDAISHWPALGRWSPQFFKRQHGAIEVEVDGERMTLAELIDRIEVSTSERPAPYLRNQLLSEWPPELLEQVLPMPDCTRPNWLESRLFPSRGRMSSVEIYIGGEGASFPVLHYDGLHTHAFLMQLYGEKEYIAFAPEQTERMYPRAAGSNLSSIDDVLEPELERFPLYGDARGVRFRLHPGETLFVPGGWWHTARILSPSVTVSTNGVNRANGAAFRDDYCSGRSTLLGLALRSYLYVGAASTLFERL